MQPSWPGSLRSRRRLDWPLQPPRPGCTGGCVRCGVSVEAGGDAGRGEACPAAALMCFEYYFRGDRCRVLLLLKPSPPRPVWPPRPQGRGAPVPPRGRPLPAPLPLRQQRPVCRLHSHAALHLQHVCPHGGGGSRAGGAAIRHHRGGGHRCAACLGLDACSACHGCPHLTCMLPRCWLVRPGAAAVHAVQRFIAAALGRLRLDALSEISASSFATPRPPPGVVWGWCVVGLAFLPYALWVLAAAPLLRSVGVLLLCLLGTLGPLVAVDRHYYGAWTVRGQGQGSVRRPLDACICGSSDGVGWALPCRPANGLPSALPSAFTCRLPCGIS